MQVSKVSEKVFYTYIQDFHVPIFLWKSIGSLKKWFETGFATLF